jgi:hypothetical protein
VGIELPMVENVSAFLDAKIVLCNQTGERDLLSTCESSLADINNLRPKVLPGTSNGMCGFDYL